MYPNHKKAIKQSLDISKKLKLEAEIFSSMHGTAYYIPGEDAKNEGDSIVFKYIDARPLYGVLKNCFDNPTKVVRLIFGALESLYQLHRKGFSHGDTHTYNFLAAKINTNSDAKEPSNFDVSVIDFGKAKPITFDSAAEDIYQFGKFFNNLLEEAKNYLVPLNIVSDRKKIFAALKMVFLRMKEASNKNMPTLEEVGEFFKCLLENYESFKILNNQNLQQVLPKIKNALKNKFFLLAALKQLSLQEKLILLKEMDVNVLKIMKKNYVKKRNFLKTNIR